ncbi:MAG: hypothetical protein PF508_16515 [Spirochaeta sp.]|nr:hypothetical protein [Spirochaeta sp.]
MFTRAWLVRYNGDAGGCYVLPFEGISDSDESGVHTYPAVATRDFVDEPMCAEEHERLHHWVQSLTTADPDARPDWETQYAAFDERVGLATAPDRREIAMMRPLAKRSRRELVGQGRQAMQHR